MSDHKIVSAKQIGTAFNENIRESVGFGSQTSINLDAHSIAIALQTMASSTGNSSATELALEGIDKLVSLFRKVNNDGSLGIYKTRNSEDYYLSGSTLSTLAELLINYAQSSEAHGQAMLKALSDAYEAAADYSNSTNLRAVII